MELRRSLNLGIYPGVQGGIYPGICLLPWWVWYITLYMPPTLPPWVYHTLYMPGTPPTMPGRVYREEALGSRGRNRLGEKSFCASERRKC